MSNILKYIEYAIIALFVFAVFYVPHIVKSDMFFPYITGKVIFFRYIVGTALAFYAILLAIDFKRYIPKLNPIFVSLTIFSAFVLVADLFGEYPLKSIFSNYERMEGWITLFYLWIFYVVGYSVFSLNKKYVVYLIYAVISSFVLVGIGGIAEYIKADSGKVVRIASSLNNPIYLAIFALMAFYLSLFLFFDKKFEKYCILDLFSKAVKTKSQHIMKILLILVAVFSLIVLFLTATRGTFVALVFSLVFVSIAIFLFEKEDKILKRISMIFLIILITIVSLLFVFKYSTYIKDNGYLNRITNFKFEGTIQARMNAWKIAIEGIKEKPIFGWGQENYHFVFNKYYNPAMYTEETWFDRTHNIFLGWAIEAGIIGLLFYILIFVSFIYVLKNTNFNTKQKWIILALIIGYLVHNSFVFDNIVSYIIIYSLFIMVSVFYVRNNKDDDIEVSNVSNKVLFISFALFAIIISTNILFNNQIVTSNKNLIKALVSFNKGRYDTALLYFEKAQSSVFTGRQEAREQLATKAIELTKRKPGSKIAKKYIQRAINHMEEQLNETPNDVRIMLHLSSLYYANKDIEKSINILKRALSYASNRQIFMIRLANIYALEGDKENAIKYAKKAFDVYPLKDTAMHYIKILTKFNEKKKIEEFVKDLNLLNNIENVK